jgi:predicted O-methyltransferase YrrM
MRVLAAIRTSAERSWLPIERGRLLLAGERRLARALDARPCPLAEQIELQRAETLKDRSPLADGSLGPPGIYDQGQTVADACRVSRQASSAQVLYSLAAEYRPQTILELGTNLGFSAAYLAASGGRVTTLEASPYRLQFARKFHRTLGLEIDHVQGLFSDTLHETLNRLPPIGMAFIDGHHQYQPTLEYFKAIASRAAPGCVFIFDDIRWSAGMRRAWSELRADPRFESVADLGGMGVCVLEGSPREMAV